MRSAAVALAVVVAGGVAALLAVAAADERDLAFTLGVAPAIVAAELAPGSEACQTPVTVAEPFSAVRAQVGTYRRPGPPIAVSVRARDGSRRLAGGRLRGGYPDASEQTVALDAAVLRGEVVEVCVRNVGDRRLALFGGPELARRNSHVTVDGAARGSDLALVFVDEPRTVLAEVPAIFDRAALFRPAWVGPWTFWALAALVLLAVPALLAAAVRSATARR